MEKITSIATSGSVPLNEGAKKFGRKLLRFGISKEIKKEMCEAALALAKSARYVGVGTV